MYQYKCECGYCKPSHSSAFSTLNQPCSHVKRNRLDGVVRGRDLKGCDNHKHLFLRKLACNLLQRTNAHNTPQQWTADEKKSVQPGVEKKNPVRVRRRFGWLHSEQSLKRGAAAIASSMECKSQWSWVQPDLAGRHHIPGNVKPSVLQISFPTHLRSNAWRGRVSEITASSFPPSPLLCTHTSRHSHHLHPLPQQQKAAAASANQQLLEHLQPLLLLGDSVADIRGR